MRCRSCDCNLNDYESTRKYPDGTYVDLCRGCFTASGYKKPIIDRPDLRTNEDILMEEFEDAWGG